MRLAAVFLYPIDFCVDWLLVQLCPAWGRLVPRSSTHSFFRCVILGHSFLSLPPFFSFSLPLNAHCLCVCEGVVLFALFQKIAIIFDLLAFFFFLSSGRDTKYTDTSEEYRSNTEGATQREERGESHLRDRIRSFRLVSPHLFFFIRYTVHSQKKKELCLSLYFFCVQPSHSYRLFFFFLSYLILFNDRRRTRTKSPSAFNCQ